MTSHPRLSAIAGLLLGSPLLSAVDLPQQHQKNPSTVQEAFVDSLLLRMTLEEKVGQLTQFRGRYGDTGPRVAEGGEDQIRRGAVGSFLGVYGASYTRQMQRLAVEESRLGIPLLFAHDVIHGFRTIFPVPLAEASSWDPEIARHSARIGAVEAAAHGLHWTFAPMVDIARDPRWGRIVEGSGEDPYLGARMAEARVRGFQGEELGDPTSILACAKHFTGYGGGEGGRDYNVADISVQTLREIYLPPFHAAVEAGVGSVMASFNEVAGVPMHANGSLIRGILRGEWRFRGVLISDYTGILELLQHGVAGSHAEAGALALRGGIDVDMVSSIYRDDLPSLVQAGLLSGALVDSAVKRVLTAKYQLGLFTDPFRYCDARREKDSVLTAAHRAAARHAAQRSVVLLKNEENLLPLSPELTRLAVIGPLATDRRSILGPWAAAGREEDAVSILEGIRRAVAPGTQLLHVRGCDVAESDSSGFEEARRTAGSASCAILVLGETSDMSGEASSRAFLRLPGMQSELARVVMATGTPVVVVLLNGRPLAIPEIEAGAQAIVEAWYGGIEAGNAVADILFGEYSPSGKLPVTFPRAVGQVPIYYNHKNTGRPPAEEERFTSKYLDIPWTPLYPFGFGLSYTTFSYGAIMLSTPALKRGDTLRVTVEVTNTGSRFGEEVVQCYVRDEVASLTRPVKALKGFQKIGLQPGERRSVSFALSEWDLAFWKESHWVTEPGAFTVFVGGSSENVQAAGFSLAAP